MLAAAIQEAGHRSCQCFAKLAEPSGMTDDTSAYLIIYRFGHAGCSRSVSAQPIQ